MVMINELRKSFNAVLYERTSSPLFGTVFISWIIFNWKVLYLTMFVSEEKITETKIDFIISNYIDIYSVVLYPLASSAVLLLIIPFISNGSYWIHLKFSKWRLDIKHEIEKNQLLTLEQSNKLRLEMAEQENLFENLLTGKAEEIKVLNIRLEEIKKTIKTQDKKPKYDIDGTPIKNNKDPSLVAEKICKNSSLGSHMHTAAELILKRQPFSGTISTKVLGFFISNDLIKGTGGDYYEFTTFGKDVYKEVLNTVF